MKKMVEVKTRLKPRPEAFCVRYAASGNAVKSYGEVYGFDLSDLQQYMTAAAGANRILKKDKISQRISELLDQAGFNDSSVDNQLNLLIKQQADLKTKMAAIKEYNNLKHRTGGQQKSIFTNNTFNLTQLLDKASALIEQKD